MASTKPRSVRVPDELWEASAAEAKANYETISDVVIRALVAYCEGGRTVAARQIARAETAEVRVANWEAVSAARSAETDRELAAAVATVLGLKAEASTPKAGA